MRKLFKSNKGKSSDLTPTPFTPPPETPIHSRQTAPTSQSTSSLKSTELGSGTIESHTGVSDDERAYAQARTLNDAPSTQASTASLPPRTSPPTPYTAANHANIAATLPSRSTSLKKKPKPVQTQVFPWPDHRISPDPSKTQTTIETITPIRNPSPKHASDSSDRAEAPKEHHKEHRFHFFASAKGNDGDKDKDVRNGKSKDGALIGDQERVIRMSFADILEIMCPILVLISIFVGNFIQRSSNDRIVALQIAESASVSEAAAKDASRELRRALKYSEPIWQVNAARLWAFLVRHSPNDLFIRECTSRKFTDALDDVLSNPKNEPVARERVVDLLGSIVLECTSDRKHPYAVIWRKAKPKGAPDEVRFHLDFLDGCTDYYVLCREYLLTPRTCS